MTFCINIELDLTVILEGPYNGSGMNTDLKTLGLIPLNQPLNSKPSADWYYTGIEIASSIPANVVDWGLCKSGIRMIHQPLTPGLLLNNKLPSF